MCHEFENLRMPDENAGLMGLKNGCLYTIPVWAAIIIGIIILKELFGHAR